jgi:pilus assembly protein CpaF
MRADRLIVGEVRGAEVFDMLQAMNTGHAGSLTTVHANGAQDAVRRLESLVMLAGFPLPGDTVKDLIANTVQMVVHMQRALDGTRRVVEIAHVDPAAQRLVTHMRYDERARQFLMVAPALERGEA